MGKIPGSEKRSRQSSDVMPTTAKNVVATETATSFSEFGLDARLWKAVARIGFQRPTLIQSHAIPILLAGSDALLRAKTGSGKTVAFLLPILHNLLRSANNDNQMASAMVLVPTRDLCRQTTRVLESLLHFCFDRVAVVGLDDGAPVAVTVNAALHHVLVGTPANAVEFLRQTPNLDLRFLVVDEADLVLSYGYDDDLRDLFSLLPSRALQTVLVSATLNPDLDAFKALVLRKPVIVRLNDADEDENLLSQYYIRSAFDDKYLLVFALVKLGVVRGKTLFFVADVPTAFRLKLFLEAFAIKSAVLNADLPINSRTEIIRAFNRGLVTMLIATDASTDLSCDQKKQNGNRGKGGNFNVARGIDFEDVANVVNFDMPSSVAGYVHRVGRVARAGQAGNAYTILTADPASTEIFEKIKQHYTEEVEVDLEDVPARCDIKELTMDVEAVHAFKYRVDDVLNQITVRTVKEARLNQLKQEIVNSEKLQSHFEDNPRELALLHDRTLRPGLAKAHLAAIPRYLLPPGAVPVPETSVVAATKKSTAERRMNKRDRIRLKALRKRKDPLKSKSSRFAKKSRR